ncbi:MAG: hypothetical protein AUH85_04165 [Chloroflexi bacterium 13_1_40CM_4_68_4]|nr:MAG: hypothetical protein AUH85_04165 [Chloroflexi bacterium 13_1_40CM_4_68_4]
MRVSGGTRLASMPGMNDKRTPKNEAGEEPTRTPEETEERLREKESEQMGQANRERTEAQIEELETGKGEKPKR